MRFRTKLIILSLAILTVITIAVSTLVYRSQKEVLTRQAAEEIEYLATSLTQGLDRLLFERMADIRFLAGDPILGGESLDRQEAKRRLNHFRQVYGYYSSLSLFDLQRIRLVDTEDRKIGQRHPRTEYWPGIEAGEKTVAGVDWSGSDLRTVIHFAARLTVTTGEERVVVSRVPLRRLLQITIRDLLPGSLAVEPPGAPESLPGEPELGYHVSIVGPGGALLYSNAPPQTAISQSDDAWSRIRSLLASGVEAGTLLHAENPGDAGRIVAFAHQQGYRSFPGLGWTTIVSLPEKAALAEVVELRNRLLLLLALIAGLSILAVGIFSARATRPLAELISAATEVRRGNLEARASIASKDEIGQLAATFNAMADELHRSRESLLASNRELNRKVEERTAELRRSKSRLEKELTNRKEIQRALADSHDYLETIINSVADPIFVKSEDYRLILVNQSLCDFMGRPCEEIVGRTDYDLFPAEEADVFRAKDRDVFASGRENVNQELITNAAGVTFTVITKKTLHSDLRGRRYLVGIFRDVTDEIRARQELEASEERFRAIAETASDALVLTDREGRIVYWNPAAESIFGYSEEEILGRSISECLPEYGRLKHQRGMDRLAESGSHPMVGKRVERRGQRRDGSEFPLELSVNSWTIKGERHFSAIIRDITDRQEAEKAIRESEERFRQIAENIREVFWMTDPEHTEQIYISPAYEEIWGRSRESWYEDPSSWIEAIHPADREAVAEASASREISGEFDEEFRIVRPDGEIRWIHDRAYPIRNEQGEVYRVVGIAEDVTERKRLESELQELLLKDELTGLYNRRGFMALAEQQLKTARRKKRHISVSFIDLDNMKWINDHQGHQAGDEALQETAGILRQTFRESDILARVGGDEFAVASIDTDRDGAARQSERLKEMVDAVNAEERLSFFLSLSVGTSTYDPERPEHLERLINRADHRMYQEKQRKKPQPMPM